MNRSASGVPVALSAAASQAIFLPVRYATLPNSTASLSAGVVEITCRRAAGLAGQEPFGVMADRCRDGLRRSLPAGELIRWQQPQRAIVGPQHSLVADEQIAAATARLAVDF